MMSEVCMRILGVNCVQGSVKGGLSTDSSKQRGVVNFGKLVNGVDYPDRIVEEAKRLLAEGKEAKLEYYIKDFMECWEDASFQPVTWLLSPYAKLNGSQEPVRDSRLALGIATLGISELFKLPEAMLRKVFAKDNAKKQLALIKSCMFDLMKEKK
jgi:hypothetical protein